MPNDYYLCEKCDKYLELKVSLERMAKPEPIPCHFCGGPVERVLSAPYFKVH